MFSTQINYFKNRFCKYLCEYFSIVFDNIQHFHDLVIAFAGVFKTISTQMTETKFFLKKKKTNNKNKTKQKNQPGLFVQMREAQKRWPCSS